MLVHGGASMEWGMVEGDCCWHGVLMSVWCVVLYVGGRMRLRVSRGIQAQNRQDREMKDV